MATRSSIFATNITVVANDYVQPYSNQFNLGVSRQLVGDFALHALRYVNKVKTPTMLVHGENDNDVPIAEAEQFYIALRDVGVETIMVRYPREGHGVRETKHVVDMTDRSIAWYQKHFDNAATSKTRTSVAK